MPSSPCKAECPAHISVQAYIELARQERYGEALELIKKDNPFPAVCGRICNKPCEAACSRGIVDDPVAIDEIKRFVAEQELKKENRYIPKMLNITGKPFSTRIAVIGAGPAGLSCAYYLAVKGYLVTVFDKNSVPGGMLTNTPLCEAGKNELSEQIESVRRFGGFYLSQYSVSKSSDGKLQSKRGAVPITNINKRDAAIHAASFHKSNEVSSHLPYEAENDSALKWLIECGIINVDKLRFKYAIRDTREKTGEIQLTGSSENRKELFDFPDNMDEWTQESYDGAYMRGCGGKCTYPLTIRCYYVPYPCYKYCGFRIALTIK